MELGLSHCRDAGEEWGQVSGGGLDETSDFCIEQIDLLVEAEKERHGEAAGAERQEENGSGNLGVGSSEPEATRDEEAKMVQGWEKDGASEQERERGRKIKGESKIYS